MALNLPIVGIGASASERLQADPEEAGALFRDLLIGVTNFFCDPAAFRVLETLVVPRLFEDKNADDEVRVWVTGCSTGEEAYSIAILLREQMDNLQVLPKVKTFATDIDEAAMRIARSACYPASSVKDVVPERLKRFFVEDVGSYHLAKDLREMCIFSTHSVRRHADIGRLRGVGPYSTTCRSPRTGGLPAVYAERPRLSKPFKMADLLDTLSSVVAPPSASA